MSIALFPQVILILEKTKQTFCSVSFHISRSVLVKSYTHCCVLTCPPRLFVTEHQKLTDIRELEHFGGTVTERVRHAQAHIS